MKLKDYGRVAILADFDGTITVRDTNVALIEKYVDPVAREKNSKKRRKMNFTQGFQFLMNQVKVDKETYLDFILNEMELSDGFKEFYNHIQKKGIKFAVVSGGFKDGIVPFLNKHGIKDVDIYSNRLIFGKDHLSIDFTDGEDMDCCQHGPCGNCKVRIYEDFKKEYDQVIFIGDGVTDKPVAWIADMVFAKDSLKDYCIEHKIEHIAWNNFHDINKILF